LGCITATGIYNHSVVLNILGLISDPKTELAERLGNIPTPMPTDSTKEYNLALAETALKWMEEQK